MTTEQCIEMYISAKPLMLFLQNNPGIVHKFNVSVTGCHIYIHKSFYDCPQLTECLIGHENNKGGFKILKRNRKEPTT